MTFQPDIVIIGAGIAGSSIAAHLATDRKVQLIEMEDSPGYHSTGRSAAVFSEAYGNDLIRALTRASRQFFYNPPDGFANAPLLSARRALIIARQGQEAALDGFVRLAASAGHIEPVSIDRAVQLHPILRPEALTGAAWSSDPADIDVNELQQGYLRYFRQRGGVITTASPVEHIEHVAGQWRVHTKTSEITAPLIINAAGAWAGEIGRLAGATDIGLRPLKRTACLVDPPAGVHTGDWPMLLNVEEEFYLKPDAGMLLLSPADETEVTACDAQADELDIAIAIDRLEKATTLTVRRVSSRWAGLRSFVADRSPVVGFDPQQPDFFWLAALGGYGIQTAPALSRIAADVVLNGTSQSEEAEGIDLARLHPLRLDRVQAPQS